MDILSFNTICILIMMSVRAYNDSTIMRHQRIFPFIIFPFPRVNVAPTPCTTATGQSGTCYSSARCAALGLTPSGSCSTGRGVCCIAIKTCGDFSSSPIIYFNSPTSLPSVCTLRIGKANSSITELRLDFVQFSLRQPQMGKCTNFLNLNPVDTTLPRICGENTGSHVYMDFDPLCNNHTLQFNFGDLTSNDKWAITITQIPNSSDLEAPRGCLMYYSNSFSGTVKSFNYGTAITTDTRLISPVNYGICVRPLPGFCQINWSLGELLMTNDAVCDRNYIVIPGSTPAVPTAATFSDRYCDNQFINASTTLKPYVLYVVTNVEDTDTGTTGFQLNFQQMAC